MKIRLHPEAVGFVGYAAIQTICSSMRWEVVDQSEGVLTSPHDTPLLYAFWHNRLFSVPYAYQQWLSHRPGSVLTSPSYDGDVLSATVRSFHGGTIRGSSNKRATASFRDCIRTLRRNIDVVITPDGPRGPRYEIKPGLAKLSQLTRVPVFPIRVEYDQYRALKTWDAFRIPKMFSKARIIFGKPYQVPAEAKDLDAEQVKITEMLGQ